MDEEVNTKVDDIVINSKRNTPKIWDVFFGIVLYFLVFLVSLIPIGIFFDKYSKNSSSIMFSLISMPVQFILISFITSLYRKKNRILISKSIYWSFVAMVIYLITFYLSGGLSHDVIGPLPFFVMLVVVLPISLILFKALSMWLVDGKPVEVSSPIIIASYISLFTLYGNLLSNVRSSAPAYLLTYEIIATILFYFVMFFLFYMVKIINKELVLLYVVIALSPILMIFFSNAL